MSEPVNFMTSMGRPFISSSSSEIALFGYFDTHTVSHAFIPDGGGFIVNY